MSILGKEIHRHLRDVDRSRRDHQQAKHENEKGKLRANFGISARLPLVSAFMSIMPPVSCTVSDAGSGEERVDLFVFLILILSADHHPVAGLSPLEISASFDPCNPT
jgi:hypothetical protein